MNSTKQNLFIYLTIIILLIFYFYLKKNNSLTESFLNINFPRIIHLIYIPWCKSTGKIKANELDFDKKFYYNFKNENKNYKIKLWTLSKLLKFTYKFYPKYIKIWEKIKHPVQAVDFYRLLIVYHYGGIYWQYGSIKKNDIDNFIPQEDFSIKLFVEKILEKDFSNEMKFKPIRKGKPEELIRVAYQCYSAYPKDEFLYYCIKKSWKNLNTLEVKSQYDILYIGGNAMFSEAYDEYEDKSNIVLEYNTSQYINFSSNGSWRLNYYE